MKKRGSKIGNAINRIGIDIVKVLGIAGAAFLLFYSFCYSVDVKPLGNEISVITRDNMVLNGVALLIWGGVCLLVSAADKKMKSSAITVWCYALLGITLAAVLAEGFWWVCAVDHIPQGDQLNLYAYSSYMMDGNYVFLEKANYFGMYPHQLGLAAIMELLFTVTGPLNYRAFQIVNVLFAAGIVFWGFKTVRYFSKRLLPAFIYCATMIMCIPLIGYTQWVYGEIPSIFFMFVAAYYTVKCSDKFRIRYAAFIIVSTGIACLYRKNSLIFLIAICIVFVLRFVKEIKIKYIIVAALTVILPILLYQGVYTYYESASGMEIHDGLPSSSWIAMGLDDSSECGPGGYVNVIDNYRENDCNPEVLDEIAKTQIKNRLNYFKENPVDAVNFFKSKITYYWNNPTYQSVYFGSIFCINGDKPDNNMFNELCFGKYYPFVLEYCDILQLIVFAGTMLYCIFTVSRKKNISDYVLIITIIGGFLFSLFWEGKARYIFPYYIMMMPLSAVGYGTLFNKLSHNDEKENEE